MYTKYKRWLAGIALLLVLLLTVAAPVIVLAYAYAGTAAITVTESSGTAYSMLPVMFTTDNASMATYGFMSATGLDVQIQNTSGAALPTMITDTQTLFAAPIAKNTNNGFNFTTGNTPLTSMPIIAGSGGYVTVADNASLEPGTAFSLVTSKYIDTTAGSGDIVSKTGALTVSVDSTTSGKINATNPLRLGDTFTGTSSGAIDVGETKTYVINYSPAVQATMINWSTFVTGGTISWLVDAYYSGASHNIASGSDNGSSGTTALGGVYAVSSITLQVHETSDNGQIYNMHGSLFGLFSVTGITSGVHTVTYSLSNGVLSLQIDSGTPVTSSFAGSIPNTVNPWIISPSPYMNYFKLTVGATEVIKFQPDTIISGTTLPNLDSSGLYPGVFTFGTNPAGVAVTIGPLIMTNTGSSSVGSSPSGSVSYAQPSSGNLTNAESPPALAAITFPLEPVAHAIATMWTVGSPMSTPATELVLIRSFAGLTIVGGAIASLLLIRGHLFISGIAGMVLMGLWCAWHVYPLGAISIAVIYLIGTILADRGGSD